MTPDARGSLTKLPLVEGRVPERIGFVLNFSFHVWYHVVERYFRARAEQYGVREVLVADARQDLAKQLDAVDALIAEGVEALVVTPVAAGGLSRVVEKAASARVPLVLEANPIPGAPTLVAMCDYDAGVKTGMWIAERMAVKGAGEPRVLDIGYPHLRPCLLRSEGFLDGLSSLLPRTRLIERVNGEANVEVARDAAAKVLRLHPEVNVIFGMDDESIRGGVEAVAATGRAPGDMLLAGFGLAGDRDKDLLASGGLLTVGLAMFPEWVGARCVDQVVRLVNGLPVRRREVTPTIPLSRETLSSAFTRTPEGWIPEFEAIARIPVEDQCSLT